jgi:Resolvase, N terminal domain
MSRTISYGATCPSFAREWPMRKGHRVGYIRVSTLDQKTERQLDGIRLDKVFTDKASGKDTKRPQWPRSGNPTDASEARRRFDQPSAIREDSADIFSPASSGWELLSGNDLPANPSATARSGLRIRPAQRLVERTRTNRRGTTRRGLSLRQPAAGSRSSCV